VVVAPAHRNRGIGTALLDCVEAQDPAPIVRRSVLPGGSPEGASLLARRRYVEVQATQTMRRVGLPPPPPALIDGYRMREARLPDEAADLAAVYNAAYAGAFGFTPLDAEEVGPGVGGRLVVLDDGQGAAAGWVQTLPGVLQTVQVAPAHQRRGLGRALTVAALNVLAQQGYAEVELTVDATNTGAVRLYESLGFVLERRDLTFERGA
jgi:mycothiol synthase